MLGLPGGLPGTPYSFQGWAFRGHLTHFKAGGAADVTIQSSKFDALGRRIKKVVTNAGDYNKTEVYFYDGQRIIQINNGSGNMVQQFIHGTQYIDELVMLRVKDKGDLYVHQDANWNVIGTTDLGGHVVERNIYTPYGELMVHQDTGFGDRDGDLDVDSTDKGTVGTTCTGTVSGSCRILDLDFDGDYDATDATKFDALTQGAMRHPGRPSTSVSQPFAHQGLPFEPELAQYQNRARQYDPTRRRFAQRDPVITIEDRIFVSRIYLDSLSLYGYTRSGPSTRTDAYGLCTATQDFWPERYTDYETCREDAIRIGESTDYKVCSACDFISPIDLYQPHILQCEDLNNVCLPFERCRCVGGVPSTAVRCACTSCA